MFGQRILLAVPHPDDEIVACAAALGRAKTSGAEIFALYLTHGCIPREQMWPWTRFLYQRRVDYRRAEAERAAHFLGVKPVGWSERPARRLWQDMDRVANDIGDAIDAHGIDQLWLPAYEGGNPDHDALNAIGQIFKKRVSVLEFAEYNFAGGRAGAQIFPFPDGSEQVVELTGAERKAKRAALAIYRSEIANLNYVGVARECYRPLADYDYSRAPHAGTLWYARFQWVPFRHPRVDFTRHGEVSAAIADFFGRRRPP